MSKRYRKSEALLKRALRTIPLGTQTFSKSKTQYPLGSSPYFLTHGQGSHVWDVDGNEYIDFNNALAAITLGYCDPDVTRAVTEQLKEGVIFTLPHPLEVEVAEMITHMVPCAEMVRYGKNGSDATAGAIRVARAHTRRDHVAVCGYHGWQDWYIGSTSRNLGVPKATQALTHKFTYNDLESLHRVFRDHPGEIAAVIMEPVNATDPHPGFLESIRELTTREGALLIFDETITGFRLSNGGAQELYKVTPDLASFGKGVANGYPLSVVAGKAAYMRQMEEVFFSFTFGGEALSLAAAKATLKKLHTKPILKTIKTRGERVLDGVRRLIREEDMDYMVSVSGHPAWSFINFSGAGEYDVSTIKTFFLQEMFARGILLLGTHNMSYAHSPSDVERLLKAYHEVFGMLKHAIQHKDLMDHLHCEPLKPLFQIRS